MSVSTPDHGDLTHSQLQIWIGQRLNPTSPLYNMAFSFVIADELRPDQFQRAWQRVVDGSDALRTSIAEHDGAAVRQLGTGACCSTTVLDFRDRPDPIAAFHAWCLERCARRLALDGSLVDSVLVQLGGGRTGWYLNQHHLIADAWSTVLVYRQVGAEYLALAGSGERPRALSRYYETAASLVSPTDGPASGPDSPAIKAARDHWQSRFAQDRRAIPFYGRRASPHDTASTRVTLILDETRSEALERLCDQDGFVSLSRDTSRFALFATLLLSWMYRISGTAELGFDAPVSGRPTAQARRAAGLFIEMFPFSAVVQRRDTLRSLARTCLEEAHWLLCHGRPGLSAPSSSAASSVVLNFFPGAFGPFAGVPAEVDWVHSGHGDHVHALRLQVHDFGGRGHYVLHFDFNDTVWPDWLRPRAVAHFEHLLNALVDDPDREIGTVDMRTDDERRALEVVNQGATAPGSDRSVVEMIHAQAQATPERTALRQGRDAVTFERLRQESDALAAVLLDLKIEPGDRVAILSRRSIAAVVAIVATLRVRAAYVPIDPGYPASRIGELIQDAAARVLLVEADPSGQGTVAGATVLSISDGIRAGQLRTIDRPLPRLTDLAYLLYTSGSTGRPKGVLIEHGGLADYVAWASRHYVRGDHLVFPLFTSLTFDLTVTSLFLPLVTGGVLEIYPEPGGPVDSSVIDVVAANAVDFIKLTPSHLSLLRRLDLSRSNIRRMVVGGEDLRTELAASISAQFGDRVEIYNEYGPTEAVVGCVLHRYHPVRDRDASVPIGLPAPSVEVDVLNEHGVTVPDGVPGELWISSPGLARGYHGLPEATADRFQPHPRRPGARRYRTGDLVRFTTQGVLEYLGRIDRQFKLSGHRIEPGEIEAAILSVPTISECAVVVRRHESQPPQHVETTRTCVRCGLSSRFPAVRFDSSGLCSVCQSYESVRPFAQAYFKTMDDLRDVFASTTRPRRSEYDCMLLLSGGKDSTYALCRLVDMGLSVYAFTLDNGFISEDAKANMRRVTAQLGVPLEFGTTSAMNAIFRDSLVRFSNVCNGCFKTIYTLSTNRAHALGIPVVVTGLSRGQMFETRLTEEMFRDGRYSPDDVDAAVLEARRAYHRVDDEVARSLDVTIFQSDHVFDEIRFVDFYRYCDVGLDEMLSYLDRTVPWVRPADTGRSTNCLINDVGIYIHQKERGYHNYALPYSWDVRLGHKERDAALDELNDDLDMDRVRRTLAEIGYDENRLSGAADHLSLAAFYVAAGEVDEEDLRTQIRDRLPAHLVPSFLVRLDALPLTRHGKIDEAALSRLEHRPTPEARIAPDGPVEQFLVNAWEEVLRLERVGAGDNFFQLGGTSLKALELMVRLCREFDIELPLTTIFRHPTLRDLARVAERRILDDVSLPAAGD